MILDAYWCADGVWRTSTSANASANEARAREGIDSVHGYKFNNVIFDDFLFVEYVKIDYEEIAKRWWKNWSSTTST